jgi:hypothetical protein
MAKVLITAMSGTGKPSPSLSLQGVVAPLVEWQRV